MGKLKALDEYIRGRNGAQSLVGSESLDALSRCGIVNLSQAIFLIHMYLFISVKQYMHIYTIVPAQLS